MALLNEDQDGAEAEEFYDKFTKPNSYFETPETIEVEGKRFKRRKYRSESAPHAEVELPPTTSTNSKSARQKSNIYNAQFIFNENTEYIDMDNHGQYASEESPFRLTYDQHGNYVVTGQVKSKFGTIIWGNGHRRVCMITDKEQWSFKEGVEYMRDMESARVTRLFTAVTSMLQKEYLFDPNDPIEVEKYGDVPKVGKEFYKKTMSTAEFFDKVQQYLTEKYITYPDSETLIQKAVEPPGLTNGD